MNLPHLHHRTRNDNAVSPVIAVILMVAITVVMAAAVYVWVTGFTGDNNTPAGTLALTQTQPMTTDDATAAVRCTAGASWCANWTVTSANIPADRLSMTDATNSVGTITCLVNGAAPTSTPLNAGDRLSCYGSTDPAPGDHMQIADTSANSIILTTTIR